MPSTIATLTGLALASLLLAGCAGRDDGVAAPRPLKLKQLTVDMAAHTNENWPARLELSACRRIVARGNRRVVRRRPTDLRARPSRSALRLLGSRARNSRRTVRRESRRQGGRRSVLRHAHSAPAAACRTRRQGGGVRRCARLLARWRYAVEGARPLVLAFLGRYAASQATSTHNNTAAPTGSQQQAGRQR